MSNTSYCRVLREQGWLLIQILREHDLLWRILLLSKPLQPFSTSNSSYCQVSSWCIAFWWSSKCSSNFIYGTPWPRLQVDCHLQLDKNIPYLLRRRLHNILWGRMGANNNNNKDARWYYLPFQCYRHEDLWPQQAHWAHQHQQPCRSPQARWVKLPRQPHQVFRAQRVDC